MDESNHIKVFPTDLAVSCANGHYAFPFDGDTKLLGSFLPPATASVP